MKTPDTGAKFNPLDVLLPLDGLPHSTEDAWLTASVLVADGSADVREYLRHLLQNKYNVIAVADGQQALHAAREYRSDLVLADVGLPGLDGFALLRALRGDPATATLPVILLSPNADEEARIEGIEAGADDYIVKPFNARELLARINGTVALARLRSNASEAERRLRVQAENAQRILHAMLDNVPAGITMAGGPPDFPIIANSKMALALLGKSADDTVGIPVGKHIASFGLYLGDGITRPLPEQMPLYRATHHGEWTQDEEWMIKRPDGSRITAMISATPIRDDDGAIIGAISCWQDVTERKRMETAMARQRQQLEDAQRLAHIGSWDWDLETDTVVWSDEHYRIFGVDPQNYRPSYDTNMQFVHPDDRQRSYKAVEEALAERGSFDMEMRLLRADGGARYVISRGEVSRDNAGRPVRMVGTIQDITEHKRAEDALRESEAKFRSLAEASPALIWQVDPDGKAMYQNQRHLDLFGQAAAGLRETGWHSVLHPDDAPAYIAAVAQALRNRGRFQQRVRVKNKQGEWRWLESYASPWFTADGLYAGHVGISIDVTEAVRAEAGLRETDRRKDEFLATLAHELRNPLASICTAMPLIGRSGGARAADRLQTIMQRQANHIVRLVDDLLEISRITRGRIELRKAPTELAEVLRSAIETSKPMIDNAGHRLIVSLPEQSLILDADNVRLTQVFANLLNNAAKFTQKGGQIWLTAYREGSDALVSVRDNGIGIASDMLPRIFDMFSQADHSISREQGGLGIGLTLVISLVRMHGGAVEGKSDGLGCGSEFIVRLPLAVNSRPGSGSGSGTDTHAAGVLSGQRILVVDDNRDAADSLAMLLESLGATMRVADNGAAALDALDTYRPHAVLLDIGMPGMDGYEVARRIRRQPQFNDIKLIALTGWGQEGDRRQSYACGLDHHLTKPVDIDVLQDALLSLKGAGG